MDLNSSKAGHSCLLTAMLLLPLLLLLILPRIEAGTLLDQNGALPSASEMWSDEQKLITEEVTVKLGLLQSRISSQEQGKLPSTTLSPQNHSLNPVSDIDPEKEKRNLPQSFLSDREESAAVKQFREISEEEGTPSKLRLHHHQPRRALQQQQQQQRQFPPLLALLNPSLRAAYVALQAWKASITSDPRGITTTWVGFNVCKYKGIFCAPPPDASCDIVVAGIDLNHGDIAGTLPEKLGLLTYLGLFHINSNRFSGSLPTSIASWRYLFELDISNNLFSGPFPSVSLSLPNLAFLDIRFNRFHGYLPPDLFDRPGLDAIFVNDNLFQGQIPENLGKSRVSVAVFARNSFSGGIPNSIGAMQATLNEIIFLGNSLEGCIPAQAGNLLHLTVLDVSVNKLSGEIPPSLSNLRSLEQLDLAFNLLSGAIPSQICSLPRLQNLTVSFNFFEASSPVCVALPQRGVLFDDRSDCINGRPFQKTKKECDIFFSSQQLCPVHRSSTPPPPPPASVPPPSPPPYFYVSPPPPASYQYP